jgi:polyferredoxin
MDKMQAPRGLIRYSTQHALEHAATHVVRPRTIVYAALLTLLVGGFVATLVMRTPVALDVIRDRNALYRDSRPGYIENVYMLRVFNKDHMPHRFELAVSGLPTLEWDTDAPVLEIPAAELGTIAARVRVEDGSNAGGGHDVQFTITAVDDPSLETTEVGRFFTP